MLPAAIDTMRLGGKTKSGTVHTRRSIRYAGHARRLVLPCAIIIIISHRYGFTAYERRGQEDLFFSLSLCVSLSLAHPPVGHSKGGERKEREPPRSEARLEARDNVNASLSLWAATKRVV